MMLNLLLDATQIHAKVGCCAFGLARERGYRRCTHPVRSERFVLAVLQIALMTARMGRRFA
jgi:hypothetical protein